MLDYVVKGVEAGRTDAGIMAIGGNAQAYHKVQIVSVDALGIVCRVKGMLGGYGEPQARPWACISHFEFL